MRIKQYFSRPYLDQTVINQIKYKLNLEIKVLKKNIPLLKVHLEATGFQTQLPLMLAFRPSLLIFSF